MKGTCARHPDRKARVICARCGDFACRECAQRVTPTAKPICAECWDKRRARTEKLSLGESTSFAKVALGIGIAALVPCLWPLQLGGVVVALVALRRTQDPRARALAWTGLALSVAGLVGSAAVALFLGIAG